jgi:hypothetical protein
MKYSSVSHHETNIPNGIGLSEECQPVVQRSEMLTEVISHHRYLIRKLGFLFKNLYGTSAKQLYGWH